MIDGVEIVHHVDYEKMLVAVIILDSPDGHRLEILDFVLGYDQVD